MAMTKKQTKKATEKIQSMLNRTAKENDMWYFACAWTDKQGRQIFSDQYHSYRLNDPLDLPMMTDKLKEFRKSFCNRVEGVLDTCVKREQFRLDTPDIDTLKTFIAAKKASDSYREARKACIKPCVTWDFGTGYPLINANYLRELLSIFPDAVLYAVSHNAIKAPIYAVSAYGDAIIMPIRNDVKQAEMDAQSA